MGNALRMLETLATVPDAGVSELARELHISKASVDRLLSTLITAGFVERDPSTRRYRLSLKIAVLAENVRSRTGIVELARATLERLSDKIHETVNLGVVLDGALVYADTIPSGHIFRIEVRPGTALPAYCTAGGKVLLAYATPERRDEYLADLVPIQHTPATLTTTAAIRAELEEIRSCGYGLDRGEMLEDARCVAAPVLGSAGAPLAAVSVTAPKSHFDAKGDELIAAVIAAASDISAEATALGITAAGHTRTRHGRSRR